MATADAASMSPPRMERRRLAGDQHRDDVEEEKRSFIDS